MGKDGFVWWQGVVENRNDPLQLGRCRVRILGWHTENKQSIPTNTLPWAHPLQPITSAAMNGIGETPLGPVEGTWVMGFFRDGEDAQEPVMMGTIGGIPEEPSRGGDNKKGFNDPSVAYPKTENVDEPDTHRLAREEAERHHIMSVKRTYKLNDVPVAVPPQVPAVISNQVTVGFYDRTTWSEPNPRYGGAATGSFNDKVRSTYPYNHVRAGETGIVEEWDSTPGSTRIHEWHPSGTFREIQNNGDRISKIKGDDFEIFAKGKNVYVQGSCNITIKGDVKTYVQGDYFLEVDGNYYESIRKDKITKIQGSDVKEVTTDSSLSVKDNKKERVGGDKLETTIGNFGESVGLTHNELIIGKNTITHLDDYQTVTSGKTIFLGLKSVDFASATNLNFGASINYNLYVGGVATQDYAGKSKIRYRVDSHIRYEGTEFVHIGGNTSLWISDDDNDDTNAVGPIDRTATTTTTSNTTEIA
tara:strand:- start:1198 stop:2616 length:1419 start_codon:yes stop_codon:yes gene_type:complete